MCVDEAINFFLTSVEISGRLGGNSRLAVAEKASHIILVDAIPEMMNTTDVAARAIPFVKCRWTSTVFASNAAFAYALKIEKITKCNVYVYDYMSSYAALHCHIVYVCLCVFMYVLIYVCMYVCMLICVLEYVCMYKSMYASMFLCTYVGLFVRMYVLRMKHYRCHSLWSTTHTRQWLEVQKFSSRFRPRRRPNKTWKWQPMSDEECRIGWIVIEHT